MLHIRPTVGCSRVAALVLATTLVASGASAQELSIAVQKLPDSLDPVTEKTNVSQRLVYSLYETLVKTDYRDGGNLKPGLATEWLVIDPRTIDFKLREGVTFHNGDTLDAADVVATFTPMRIGLDESVPVASKPFLGGIRDVEVIDDMTVRIHMKSDDAIALNRFASFPSHIISADAFNQAEAYEDFASLAIGTGPYRLVSHDVGKEVVFERFDDYWGESKAAARIVTLSAVPELSTRIAGLFAGQFDIVTEVGVEEFAEIEGNPEAAVVGGPIENIRNLFYDTDNEVLNDPRVRQALDLSIDREFLVEELYRGRTSVPPGWQMDIFGEIFLEDRAIPEFNPEKAKALLAKSSYDGEEIVYRTRKNYYTKQLRTAQLLQSMWRSVGLNVVLEVMENRAQVRKDDRRRMIEDGSSTAYFPDPMGQFWRRFGPEGWYTRNGYWTIPSEVRALGHRLATSVDTGERRWTFARMLDWFDADPRGSILHMLASFYGVRSDRIELSVLPSEYLDLSTDGVTFKE